MTKEEALKILNEFDRVGVNIIKANDAETTQYNNDSIEALNMAIQALQDSLPHTEEKINEETYWDRLTSSKD